MNEKSNKIGWNEVENTSEDAFKAFLKAKKMKGLPEGYHKPEIFD